VVAIVSKLGVRAGIEMRVYDRRGSKYLPVSELPDPDLNSWLVRHQGQCCLSVLARNEAEARQATKHERRTTS
jgi:hypothetical protein